MIWIVGFSTSEGDLVVEAEIDDVEVVVSANDHQVAIINEESGPQIKLQCGNYQLELKNNQDGFQLNQDQITVERGTASIVKISRRHNRSVLQKVSTHDVGNHALTRSTVHATFTVPSKNMIESKSAGMKLKLIPAGTFMMGSPPEEASRTSDEGPQHSVEISQPFYIGVHEVTQHEYQKVMSKNPSWYSSQGGGSSKVDGQDTAQLPVEMVSWYDAIEYCNKLSEKDGLSACYSLTDVILCANGSIKSASVSLVGRTGYRLPTEAEWEYACRGTTETPFEFGNILNGDAANVNGNLPYGTSTKGAYLKRPTAVGSYAPNHFGLYDTCGNVWEWCFDSFDENAYGSRIGTTKDPVVTSSSDSRVLRGGSWVVSSCVARSAGRFGFLPNVHYIHFGFRVVRDSEFE